MPNNQQPEHVTTACNMTLFYSGLKGTPDFVFKTSQRIICSFVRAC